VDTTANKLNARHPVCIITGVNSENHTIVLGQALLHDEKIESWHFVFESLRKQTDGICPDIIWTDDDPAVPTAINETYGENHKVVHLLCDWHVRGSVKKKLLFSKVGRWLESLETAFAKVQYSESETLFNENMAALLKKIENDSSLLSYF
jgi:hypothetical protein